MFIKVLILSLPDFSLLYFMPDSLLTVNQVRYRFDTGSFPIQFTFFDFDFDFDYLVMTEIHSFQFLLRRCIKLKYVILFSRDFHTKIKSFVTSKLFVSFLFFPQLFVIVRLSFPSFFPSRF